MHPGSQFCSRSMSLEFVETEHGFQLATLDSAATGTQMVVHDHKRKSRWGAVTDRAKKGPRVGIKEDKPFRPQSFLEMPLDFTDAEVEQFMREQRLEELHTKMQTGEIEIAEPDIRPPSPPPMYDKLGNRTNTREVRILKVMEKEYQHLVRFMEKHIDGYLPPSGFRRLRLVKKIKIPVDKYPDIQFMSIIVGARGINHKRLQMESQCRIEIRGKGIIAVNQTTEEENMPQHVHIEGDMEENLAKAEAMILPLLDPKHPDFEKHRWEGQQQLAQISGYTLVKSEMRCNICGAIGHPAAECPEQGDQRYKFAHVRCEICGDGGHVSMDCPKKVKQATSAAEWRETAAARQEVDAGVDNLMSDLGIDPGTKRPRVEGEADPPKAQGVPAGDVIPPSLQHLFNGGKVSDSSLTCPLWMAGSLIGPGGSNVRHMAQQSSCRILIHDKVARAQGLQDCNIEISGSSQAHVDGAKSLVQSFIADQIRIRDSSVQMPGYAAMYPMVTPLPPPLPESWNQLPSYAVQAAMAAQFGFPPPPQPPGFAAQGQWHRQY